MKLGKLSDSRKNKLHKVVDEELDEGIKFFRRWEWALTEHITKKKKPK